MEQQELLEIQLLIIMYPIESIEIDQRFENNYNILAKVIQM